MAEPEPVATLSAMVQLRSVTQPSLRTPPPLLPALLPLMVTFSRSALPRLSISAPPAIAALLLISALSVIVSVPLERIPPALEAE